MKINSNAPAYYKTQIIIDAPVEKVWAMLSNISSWPDWNTEVKSATLNGKLEPGTTFRWKSGGSTVTSKLLEVTAPNTIGWSGRTMSIAAHHVFVLAQTSNGTTVTTEECFEGLLTSLFRNYMQKTLQKSLDKNLADLKTACES